MNPEAGVNVYWPVVGFITRVPVPAKGWALVYTGFKVVKVPESLDEALPLTGTFIGVAVKSGVAFANDPTRIMIVVFVQTTGFTAVLQIV